MTLLLTLTLSLFSYSLPFTFKRCDAIDSLINSTHLAFGDTSPGQIAALADAVAKHAQNFPGYCCQDTAEMSGIWGEPVSCEPLTQIKSAWLALSGAAHLLTR